MIFNPMEMVLIPQMVKLEAGARCCPVGWGCRIHRLHFCRGVRPLNECPGFYTKQSDGEVPVMLGVWVMKNTAPLPLLQVYLDPQW